MFALHTCADNLNPPNKHNNKKQTKKAGTLYMDAPLNEWRQRRALSDAQELADDFGLPDEAWGDVDAAAKR